MRIAEQHYIIAFSSAPFMECLDVQTYPRRDTELAPASILPGEASAQNLFRLLVRRANIFDTAKSEMVRAGSHFSLPASPDHVARAILIRA